IEKTVNGVTTRYILSGTQVAYEMQGNDTLHYSRDGQGGLFALTWNEETYFYVHNLQGDVIGLLDRTGALVVRYTYDTWGKPLTVEGSLAETLGQKNPYRYRGYAYDAETGLYYLGSRYYNPEIGRFLNSDDSSTLFVSPNELTDKNLFAYCDNNPIMRTDEEGDCWIAIGAIVGGVIGATVSAVSQYATTGKVDLKVIGVNFVSGAISGAVASTGIGLGASVGINAALGGGTYAAEQAVKGEKVTVGGVVASTIAGGLGGRIGGKGANAKGLTAAWKSASRGISREMRRANVKYATKQIAKFTAEKVAAITSTKVAISRLTFGTIVNTFARWKLGY
ncbi:RHS repeat-associated core domain-containing protein, partial [Proteiniclasticum sp. BAD-10]